MLCYLIRFVLLIVTHSMYICCYTIVRNIEIKWFPMISKDNSVRK